MSCGYYNMHSAQEFISIEDVKCAIEAGNTWGEPFKTGSAPLSRILNMLVTPPIVPYID